MHERPEAVVHRLGGDPYGSQFIVAQNSVARSLCRLGARHPASHRDSKIIGPGGVPSEYPPQVGERPVGHDGAVLVFDAVEQPRYV